MLIEIKGGFKTPLTIKDSTVEVYNSEPMAGTYLIAEGLGIGHRSLCDTLRKYKDDFCGLKTRKLKSTRGYCM